MASRGIFGLEAYNPQPALSRLVEFVVAWYLGFYTHVLELRGVR